MALVPRPRHSASPFVVKDSPCLGSGESPNDFSPTAVTARGPGARAITEGLERVDDRDHENSRDQRLASISAGFNQLPCLGV